MLKKVARWLLRDDIAFLKKQHDEAASRAHKDAMLCSRLLTKAMCYETIKRCFNNSSQIKEMGFKTLDQVVAFEVNREQNP